MGHIINNLGSSTMGQFSTRDKEYYIALCVSLHKIGESKALDINFRDRHRQIVMT